MKYRPMHCDRCGQRGVKFEVVGRMIVCQHCAGRIRRMMKKVGRLSA
jgi:hypothetical protein